LKDGNVDDFRLGITEADGDVVGDLVAVEVNAKAELLVEVSLMLFAPVGLVTSTAEVQEY